MSQIFSLDLVFAMLVFSSLIGAFFLLNSKVPFRISSSLLDDSLRADSESALYALLATAGAPSNWSVETNVSKLTSLGLASTEFVLDEAKVAAVFGLNSTNYSAIKNLLALSKPDYEAEFSLKFPNGTSSPVFGMKRKYQNQSSSVSSGFASYRGETVLASLIVWVDDSND
ncbi:MAG: hypothetical protein V1820_04710 [archaeon]